MRRVVLPLVLLVMASQSASAESAEPAEMELNDCLAERGLTRVARVLDPAGRIVYARVSEERDGVITRVVEIADQGTRLADVFDRAAAANGSAFSVSNDQVCAVVDLPEADLDAERRVIVSTGLNYAAHAEEAGGGTVFLFPKPAAPTSAYSRVSAPSGVTLFDYEVELAFVLLEDIDLMDPPSRETFLEQSAFFLSNDFSDREAIIKNAALSGVGTGFVEGKGQPGFFPAGPWMVRGKDLFDAVEACGADGLGLQLSVDSGDGPELRQSATTARMITQPYALIGYLSAWIEANGLRTPMPFERDGALRFYPLAVGEGKPLLTEGSVIQTGTPEGVALNAPDGVLGLTLRGLVRLRSPFGQFLVEERERVAEGGTRYLSPGDQVLARIDGLGAQVLEIGEPGAPPERVACANVPH
jgi:2-keto-4-pentenoate hydratase/2-oxohepta-3-ene-1,7-dioic acid hydratase in catechol pathway